ncbi:olfactory receptor 52B2-like [Protopterus annectens]|uniref:olfactory receptor 52B2-like n=1 Tax=Protopterus annectens TaxID=7888 RepID=UPI001CFA3337|nr:olfactory receptor 52B2-like [Protopterus annectens]
MAATNQSGSHALEFVLTGFPGLHDIQHWLSVPFLLMFIVALFGNLMVIIIIATEKTLHKPMYYFISILLVGDLITGVSLLPQVLVILWLGSQRIYFNTCIIQMFFIYFTVAMESALLVLMAYDRYTAICNPLRYSSIVTDTFILKGVLAGIVRSLSVVLPVCTLTSSLSYHIKSFVTNVYCEYLSIISVACTRSVFNDIFLYFVFTMVILPDIALVGISYYMIAKTTLKLKSREARLKVFRTCTSHVFVILSFYISGALTMLIFLVKNSVPAYMNALFSVLYISIPPAFNPVIYGIKTKEILNVILSCVQKYKNNMFDLRND